MSIESNVGIHGERSAQSHAIVKIQNTLLNHLYYFLQNISVLRC
jgi:hypothetical protein